MSKQTVMARREALAACMTCLLCKELLKEATTISECLHTFCRKCIYDKINEEEVDCCPVCNIALGCAPVEKLRPDHSLQDIRATIFPLKRRKVTAHEIMPSIFVPVRRKERSLSSLGVGTPCISMKIGLTKRQTKAVARRAAALRESSFSLDEHLEREQDSIAEERPERSSSVETLNKTGQNERQISVYTQPSNHMSNEGSDEVPEQWSAKTGLGKPLNCLPEVANGTKGSTFMPVGYTEKEKIDDQDHEVQARENRDNLHNLKVEVDKNNAIPTPSLAKARKVNGLSRKRVTRKMLLCSQSVLDAAGGKRTGAIWFSLVASDDQEGDVPLPQISSSYLRIKDGSMPVSFIQKYLAYKLNLTSEAEVEIIFRGQPLVPSMTLHKLVDMWFQTSTTTQRMPATLGDSAKDFVMVLVYGRKCPRS